ncbi:MAG: hypothetical protein ACYCZN_15240 [Candidatus Dormibacteria bacterium]
MAAVSVGRSAGGNTKPLPKGGYPQAQQVADAPAPGVDTQLSFEVLEDGGDGTGAVCPALHVETAKLAVATGMSPGELAAPPGPPISPVTEAAPPPSLGQQPTSHGARKEPPPPNGAGTKAEAGPREIVDRDVKHREVWSLAQLRRLVDREARSTEIKSFKSLAGSLPQPVVVRGPGGQYKVVRGESIVAAAIALDRPQLVMDVYQAGTEAKFVVEVLRALGPLGQPTRDPVLRVTLIARLRALKWASIDIAGAAGWTPPRVCQLLRVADLQTSCPAAWSLFRRRCMADEVARKIAVNLARDPSRITAVTEMLQQVDVDLSDLAATRGHLREVVATAFPRTWSRGRSATSIERSHPQDSVGRPPKNSDSHLRREGRAQASTRGSARGVAHG